MARRQPFGNVSRLPSRRWRARYRDPRAKPPRRGPWINAPTTYTTKAAAEAWLARVRSDVERGTWKHPDDARAEQEARERKEAQHRTLSAVTVQAWAEGWLGRARTRGRPWAAGTLRKRRSNVKAHILPLLGGRRLVDLSPEVVESWYWNLPSDGVRVSCYQTLRAMLSAAVDSPGTALTANPCQVAGGGRARPVRGERFLLRREQVDALAAAIRPEARALVILLADAGLRINEALALRREDVTIGDGTAFVTVAHSLVRDGRRLTLGPTKTRRARRVQVTAATADALAAHMAEYTGAGDDAPVFPSPTDGLAFARETTLSRWLRQAMADAGVVVPAGRYGGFHAFRHYSATMFGRAGASTAVLQRRYGWVKAEQAIHYQRVDDDYERDIVDRMAADAGAPTWSGRVEEKRAVDAAGVADMARARKTKDSRSRRSA